MLAVKDDQDALVWVNPAWVKMVYDRPGVGCTLEFMDGHQIHINASTKRIIKGLNASMEPVDVARAAVEAVAAEPAPAAAASIKAVA
ncbi:hypothetical protein ASG17_01390 [Brevundimonas sp. Leaf363]|nr:hypothetical protein ASG17_01390 [Brevundimonas sp. Leaf363]